MIKETQNEASWNKLNELYIMYSKKMKMLATENLIQEKPLKLRVYGFSNGKSKKRRRQGQFMLNLTEIKHWPYIL